MTSLSANPVPASIPTDDSPNKNKVELAHAATMLLPGLRQARTLLDLAISVLSHFEPSSPAGTVINAEAAARIRRALAEFGHPHVRR